MVSPNRKNIFLSVEKRLPDIYGMKTYEKILRPIAEELSTTKEKYPMTVIYLGLKYCGYAFRLFDLMIKDQFVSEDLSSVSRLFTQFHAPATKAVKDEILNEIKKTQSRIRVIFATAALGMGVNAPNISNIIHIRPPSNLLNYIQEIGRAGRTGDQSCATLYYNNSDIAKNKDKVSDEMK